MFTRGGHKPIQHGGHGVAGAGVDSALGKPLRQPHVGFAGVAGGLEGPPRRQLVELLRCDVGQLEPSGCAACYASFLPTALGGTVRQRAPSSGCYRQVAAFDRACQPW